MLDRTDEGEVYAGFVSQDTVCMCMGIAMMNGLKICAADVYLNADAQENVCTVLDDEFGDGWAGTKVLFDKACYGLPLSGTAFHAHLANVLINLGFTPSKADSDLWMRDAGDHYEYVATY